jgi:hypothetical protein
MNPDDERAHREAQEVLPWLANGRLAGAELERVQAHLHACADCRTDLALLHTLRAAGSAPLPGLDPERALAHLRPMLEARPEAANDRFWLRGAVAMQCCVIAVLGVLLARQPEVSDAEGGAFHVLGAAPGPQAALVVTFKPDTSERELRRIVRASGARIVGGPTVTDAWLLGSEEAPAPVLARLRAEPAVTLAETLGAGDKP